MRTILVFLCWIWRINPTNGFLPTPTISSSPSRFGTISNLALPRRGGGGNNEGDYDIYAEEQDVLETGHDQDSSSASRRRRPLRRAPSSGTNNSQTLQSWEMRQQEARSRHAEALKDPTLLTKTAFADRHDISAASKRGLSDMLGLQQMTVIQARTYAVALEGKSVLGRARTGTGKTLAFLLPIVERLLEADLNFFIPGQTIGAIVIAPTRELALQIAEQAEALLTYHNDLDVACVYGGTKLQRDMRLLSGPKLPAILVATPGRLLEHMDNHRRIGRRSKFSDLVQQTNIIVLDEADRLLDGFSKEIKCILSYLPRAEKRQTLLFSATIPKKLRGFVKGSMNIDFEEIDCINSQQPSGDQHSRNNRVTLTSAPGETNVRVEQSYYLLPNMTEYIPTLVKILQHAMQEEQENYKIIVFFPASKLVRFFVNFFRSGLEIPVLEIHSRMSQASRRRASGEFRKSKRAILFTSDLSARGVDYPDVSLVLQYGAPTSEDLYIHRLGRTGRAGKKGRGILVLLPFEHVQLKGMQKRGIELEEEDEINLIAENGTTTQKREAARLQIRSGHALLTPNAESACRAFLAYYIGSSSLQSAEVFRHAEEFMLSTGLTEMPAIESKIARRLGIEGLVREAD